MPNGYLKILLFLLLHFICVFSINTQQLVNNSFMETPLTVHFINENTGFAGGANLNFVQGEIKKTTDGGITWSTLYSNPNTIFGHFWIFSQSNILATGGGDLFKTTDYGITWNQIQIPAFVALTGIVFSNTKIGYMCGDGFFNPAFLKTTDGGNTWINISLDTNLDLGDVDFINDNTGYTVGNRIIIKTTNGGNTLTQKIFNTYYLSSVTMLDSEVAFAAGFYTNQNNCLIIKSQDAGNSWFMNYNNSFTNIKEIKFINSNLGFAVGGGGIILKTTNQGVSWIERVLNDTVEFQDVYFINENTGWVVGTLFPGGLLYKTTDSGENWVLQNTLTEYPTEFSLMQNYPNPFNPKTKMRYKLGNLSEVLLKIYDVTGREVKTLVDKHQETGVYEVEFDGSALSSGVYFYKIDVKTLNTIVINRYSESKKMVLVK